MFQQDGHRQKNAVELVIASKFSFYGRWFFPACKRSRFTRQHSRQWIL